MSFFHPILILVPFRNDNLVRRDKPTDSVVKILFRLRLKVILEQKRFETIDYIDDVVEKVDESKDDDSNSEEEQKYDISISLDYEDYIKEYISKQKIDNDKFKSGLMEEYDKVIEIYKEEFKNKIK